MKNNPNYWNNIGKNYEDTWKFRAKRYISEKELLLLQNAIENYLHKNRDIKALEIGFGTGRFLSVMDRSTLINEIYGMDFSQSMLDYCKEKFKNSKKIKALIIGNVSKKLPYRKNGFGLINAMRVLKYSKNWKNILKNCFDILKKEGIFMFEMPNNYSINALSKDKVKIYRTNAKELTKTLEGIGFKILEIKGGPVLPALIYSNVRDPFFTKLILYIESRFKHIFGDIFGSRLIYVICKK